jgi:transposase
LAKGITDNQHRRSQIDKDGLRLGRRFRDHQDMILRFTTDLIVGFTSNEAKHGVRPVKWGINALDALTQLFAEGPWLPAAIRPG